MPLSSRTGSGKPGHPIQVQHRLQIRPLRFQSRCASTSSTIFTPAATPAGGPSFVDNGVARPAAVVCRLCPKLEQVSVSGCGVRPECSVPDPVRWRRGPPAATDRPLPCHQLVRVHPSRRVTSGTPLRNDPGNPRNTTSGRSPPASGTLARELSSGAVTSRAALIRPSRCDVDDLRGKKRTRPSVVERRTEGHPPRPRWDAPDTAVSRYVSRLPSMTSDTSLVSLEIFRMGLPAVRKASARPCRAARNAGFTPGQSVRRDQTLHPIGAFIIACRNISPSLSSRGVGANLVTIVDCSRLT